MSRSFTWIFWGLLFSCLDLKINGFDLLVDLLGYVFVAIGCYGLPRQSPRFRLAGHLAVVMAFLEVVVMTTGNPGDLFKLAWYGFQIAMVWTLLGGVIDLAAAREWAETVSRATRRRLIYTIVSILSALLSYGRGWSGGSLVPLAAVIAIVVVAILILLLILKVRRGLRAEERSLPLGAPLMPGS